MEGSDGRAVELEQAASLEDAVDDGLSEVLVVEDTAPGIGRLVGREDHRAAPQVAFVDDVEEHVRRVGAVCQVAHLVHDQDVRMRVAQEIFGEPALSEGKWGQECSLFTYFFYVQLGAPAGEPSVFLRPSVDHVVHLSSGH
ncbi:MAG: hypothetical protein M0R80_24235, partial [Proteobacteria bacterium]|nr:hypothetical protein [Pseudomonadota bacterium]